MGKYKTVWIGVGIGVVIFLLSYLSWQVFVVGYLGLHSCNPLQWLALWGLVVTVLLIVAAMVEVLRDK